MTRRRFLKFGLSALALAILPSCSAFEPRPFLAGGVATPPIGCLQLREDDPRGDC